LRKVGARPAKDVAHAIEVWSPPMKKSLGSAPQDLNFALELFMLVSRVDDIWKNDTLDRERTQTMAQRMAGVPRAEVTRWRKALTAAQGDGVSDFWTLVLISRTDALFGGPGGTLDPPAEARLLDRLKVVPGPIVRAVAAAVHTAKADAALRIVENDRFFDGAALRGTELDQGVAALRALRPASK
jgi:hypothetical protein